MKKPSPSSLAQALHRIAELKQKLSEKQGEILELRRELSSIAKAVRSATRAAELPKPKRPGTQETPPPGLQEAKPQGLQETPPPGLQEVKPQGLQEVKPPVPQEVQSPEPQATPSPPVPPAALPQAGAAEAQAEPPPAVPARAPLPDGLQGGGRPRWENWESPAAGAALPAAGVKPTLDLEMRIGAVWFNRIGLVALLIGFALFARYFHELLHPWHKVAGGYLGSLALFAVGWIFEERLKVFARPVLAGGLALAFFTSFAAHFVKPMQCMPLTPSLLLMSANVGALFVCAERWRSEPTAGFAIFLGHVAAYVAGGDADTFSLVAILFLSAAALGLFLRNDWVPLSLFAVVASFASHLLWAVQEHPVTSVETRFWVNFNFLTSYYAIFLSADLIYRQRLWKSNHGRYSRGQQLAARAVGPSTLVLYATFTAGFFRATAIYWESIHLYFFPLAALQVLIAAYHRRRSNADWPFYAASAATLLTLGLFSWLEGLSLNMTLAAEALLLLVLARRLRLWFLHPLAQLVLAVNFIHYWFSGARDPQTWPAYLGSTATALVYLVKSRLEETWEPPLDDAILEGKFARRARQVFDSLAPSLAYVHAFLGAVLLSHQCRVFFSVSWEVLVPACFALAACVISVWLGSGPMLISLWTLQTGCVLAFLAYRQAGPRLPNLLGDLSLGTAWIIDQAAVSIFAVCAGLAFASAEKWRRPLFLLAGAGGLAILFTAAWFACDVGEPVVWLLPLWAMGPAVFWIEAELAQSPAKTEESLSAETLAPDWEREIGARVRRLRWLFALAGAILTVHVVLAVFPSTAAGLWFLALLGPAAVFAVLRRDSPQLLPGLIALFALTGGSLVIALLDEDVTPDTLLVWFEATSSMVAASALLSGATVRKRGSFALGGLVALSIALGIFTALLNEPGHTFSPLLPWLLATAGFWLTAEPFRALFSDGQEKFEGWRDRVGVDLLRTYARPLSMGLSLAAAGVILLITARHFARGNSASLPAAEAIYALLFLFAASACRSSSLAGAYAFSLSAAYVAYAIGIFLPAGAQPAWEHPFLTLFLVVVALVSGAATENFYRNRQVFWSERQRLWAAAGAWYPYVLSLLLGGWFVDERGAALLGSPAMGFPSRLMLALAILALGERWRLEWLKNAARGFALLVALVLVVESAGSPGAYPNIFQAGLIVGALLLVMERLTVRWSKRGANAPAQESISEVFRLAAVVTCGTVLLAVLAFARYLQGSWTTLGWSLVAFFFAGLGFLWKDRNYRRTALAAFGLTLIRVVFVDMQSLELYYRMIAFLGLGACLLAVSFLYSRYKEEIQRWL